MKNMNNDTIATVGNTAKMREALEAVSKAFDDALICTDYQMSAEEHDRLDAIYRQVKEALAAPPRRCDIYTPDVAAHIMDNYCYDKPGGFCDGRECSKCSFEWYTSENKGEQQ